MLLYIGRWKLLFFPCLPLYLVPICQNNVVFCSSDFSSRLIFNNMKKYPLFFIVFWFFESISHQSLSLSSLLMTGRSKILLWWHSTSDNRVPSWKQKIVCYFNNYLSSPSPPLRFLTPPTRKEQKKETSKKRKRKTITTRTHTTWFT